MDIFDEATFIRLVCSFGKKSNEIESSSTVAKKVIICINVLFVGLVIADLVLTNLYSSTTFPLYTASLLSSYTWTWLQPSTLIIYILFIVAAICAFCCGCGFIIWCCCTTYIYIDDKLTDDTNSMVGMAYVYMCIYVIVIPFSFVAVMVLIIFFFCFSPPLILYLLCLLYVLANAPNISELAFKWQYIGLCMFNIQSTHDMKAIINGINRSINIVPSRDNKYRLLYRRLSQYILALMLWPTHENDVNRSQIKSKLVNKINYLMRTDINKAINEINSENQNNIFAELGTIDNSLIDIRLNWLINRGRICLYVYLCVSLYIIITILFFVCNMISEFSNDNELLFLFYVISYPLYFILLFLCIILSYIKLKQSISEKYSWIFTVGGNQNSVAKYKFNEAEYIRLYCYIYYEYVTYQSLKYILVDSVGEWLLNIIIEYLFETDIHKFIDYIYIEKNSIQELTNYFSKLASNNADTHEHQSLEMEDPTELQPIATRLSHAPQNIKDIHWRNCIEAQHKMFMHFLEHKNIHSSL